MLEKLRIKQCCCCFTTRKGSLVIGSLGWIGSLMHTLMLTSYSKTDKDILNEELNQHEEESGSNISAILISIFMFGVSVALVVGIYKDDRKFILPWLIIKFVENCVLTIIVLILFFLLFLSENVGIVILIFGGVGLLTALLWYCWICVWSFYMDLGETFLTIVPSGQNIPMNEPVQYSQYTVDEKIRSPIQEMV